MFAAMYLEPNMNPSVGPQQEHRLLATLWRMASARPARAAMLSYLLASALLTWPLVFHMDSMLFGDYGDTRGEVWWLWAKTEGLLNAPINHLIAAPFGMPADPGFSQPFSEWLLIALAGVRNEIVAFNLYVFLAFPLTAIATYCLLDRLLHDKLPAFTGGLIFGFCPAVVMQSAGGHAAFAFNAFIPVFLLSLFYNRSRRTLLSAFYVAATFALITFSTLYFGYFAIYIAIFFAAFDFFSCDRDRWPGMVRSYILAAAFAILLILPFEYKAIYHQIAAQSETLANSGRIRNINELAVFSSRPLEYLVPSIDHPILGKFAYEFVRDRMLRTNLFEQTLYLGVIPLGLLLTGLMVLYRGKFDVDRRIYFVFFAFGALWMYFLSLPPTISIGRVSVPTVSYFAYAVAPMFRVYARFGILVMFFVACAGAVVLSQLHRSMKRTRYRLMVGLLLPVLIFEFWSIPPSYALLVNQPPEVYRWLAKEPGDIIVAEYPMVRSDEAAFYTYLFWQRLHKKKLVNGASPENMRAWEFFLKVQDLSNPETPALLKSVGVKYVIVHAKMYEEGPIPEPLKRYYPAGRSALTFNGGAVPAIPLSLAPHRGFGSDMVFSLEHVPLDK